MFLSRDMMIMGNNRLLISVTYEEDRTYEIKYLVHEPEAKERHVLH